MDDKIPCFKFNTCDVQLINALIDAHATTLIYFFSNNKLLRNLEEEGDKGKDRGIFHKSHIIIEYNIA